MQWKVMGEVHGKKIKLEQMIIKQFLAVKFPDTRWSLDQMEGIAYSKMLPVEARTVWKFEI